LRKDLLALLCIVSLSFSIYVPPSSLPGQSAPKVANTTSLLPSFSLLAQHSTDGIMTGLLAAKMSSASKYDMIPYMYVTSKKPSDYYPQRNYTYYLYSYDGTSINFLSSSYPYNAYEEYLHLYTDANPSAGTLALGGYYKAENNNEKLLYYGKMNYSSGKLLQPSKVPLAFTVKVNERIMLDVASGNVLGGPAEETLLLFKEYKSGYPGLNRAILYIPNGTGKYTYELPKFTSGALAVGNFAPPAGNEIALVRNNEHEKSWLYLLKIEAEKITKVSSRSLDIEPGQEGGFYFSSVADIDADGYDELLLAGTQKPADINAVISTSFFHVYKYATSGWALKNAYTFSDMANHSYVSSVGFSDVNIDGKQEIVIANHYSFWKTNTYCGQVAVAMFGYEPAKASPALLYTDSVGSADHCITLSSSKIADFDGNGKKELAVAYYDNNDKVLALYSLGYSASKSAGNATNATNKTAPSLPIIPQAAIPNMGKGVEEAAPLPQVPSEAEPAPEEEEAAPEPQAPQQEPATPQAPEQEQPAPEEQAQAEPQTPQPEEQAAPQAEAPSGQPSAPASPQPTSPAPSTGAAKAQQAVSALEESIASAKSAGANTSAAESYLAKAQSSLSSGNYSQASTNAARGETLVEAALARMGGAPAPQPATGTGRQQQATSPAGEGQPETAPGQPPTAQSDYTPYYVGVAAVVVLAVAYMFTHRQQPPAPERKRGKK
jgi:hypothetical protein